MNIKKTYNRLYRSWGGMRQRVYNPNSPDYHNYGGRGISICSKCDNFMSFKEDMGDRPQGKTLDRINNDGDYTPDNCQWSTPIEQARNRKNNFKFNNETATAVSTRLGGKDRHTIRKRLEMGWSIEKAFSIPIRRYKHKS